MSAQRGMRRHHPLRWALIVVTLVVAVVFLEPKVDEAIDSLHKIDTVSPWWLAVALFGEVASLIVFSAVTWLLISAERRPTFRRTVRLDLATVALSHAVPAGAAAGTALGYELLEEEGVGGLESGFVKVSQSLISGVLLQVLLGLALLLKIVVYGPSASNVGLAGGGLVLVALVGGFTWMLAFREHAIASIAVRLLGWIPRVRSDAVRRAVNELSARMRALMATPRLMGWVCLWSLANWMFDLLSLWASLRAFGVPTNPLLLTVGFCVAQVAAALPISPAGLGVVESSLVPILVSFGTDATVAVLGVLVWRLFNFWLPLPVGAVAYLGIVVDRHRKRPRRPPDDFSPPAIAHGADRAAQ